MLRSNDLNIEETTASGLLYKHYVMKNQGVYSELSFHSSNNYLDIVADTPAADIFETEKGQALVDRESQTLLIVSQMSNILRHTLLYKYGGFY